MSKLTSALSLARFNLVKIVVAPYAETNINVGCFTRLDITVMAFDLDPIVRPKNFAATICWRPLESLATRTESIEIAKSARPPTKPGLRQMIN